MYVADTVPLNCRHEGAEPAGRVERAPGSEAVSGSLRLFLHLGRPRAGHDHPGQGRAGWPEFR